MELFTGTEYLLIDIANNLGYDKENYQTRIQKALDTFPLDTLKNLSNEAILSLIKQSNADVPELVFAGLMALRDTLNGIPSGYRVSFDAVCSGTQIMSALTRDISGLNLTGMIENHRYDLYTEVYKRFQEISGVTEDIKRNHIKKAVMTLYGVAL